MSFTGVRECDGKCEVVGVTTGVLRFFVFCVRGKATRRWIATKYGSHGPAYCDSEPALESRLCAHY